MALKYHPVPGTIVICNFGVEFKPPEMIKRRPCVVISPQMQGRPRLITVVPIGTGKPAPVAAFHVELPNLTLPHPFDVGPNWVKGDMVFAASFERCDLIKTGKDNTGKRIYDLCCINQSDLKAVRCAVLHSIGLSSLTKHMV